MRPSWTVQVYPCRGTALRVSPWVIVTRCRGHVEVRSAGCYQWSPVWRSRVVNSEDEVRVLDDSECTMQDIHGFRRFGPKTLILLVAAKDPRGNIVGWLQDEWPRVRQRAVRALGRDTSFEIRPGEVYGAAPRG